MSHQQLAATAPAAWVEKPPALPFITDCQRIALDQLGKAFTESRPLAVLIGKGKSSARLVIDSFLAGIEGEVAVARITEPCSDATAVMGKIIQSIGFEPKDMGVADLENVFTMFLSFQRTHHRRTIVCIEEAQDNGQWVLDRVRRLVDLETDGRFGLTVILAGQPRLNELLNEPPLSAISSKARSYISLAPFTLAETTEYIRRRVESAGTKDIGQVFEFQAISLLHELSAGVPDALSVLCGKCLQLAQQAPAARVTTDLVKDADRRLRLASIKRPDVEVGSVEIELKPELSSSPHARIVLTHNGNTLREMTMEKSQLMIGAAEDNDLQINSKFISRHHALIIQDGGTTMVMDLNSTNGTYVNSRRISNQFVIDQDVISVGDHDIRFMDANAGSRTRLETAGFNDPVIMKGLAGIRKVLARRNAQTQSG